MEPFRDEHGSRASRGEPRRAKPEAELERGGARGRSRLRVLEWRDAHIAIEVEQPVGERSPLNRARSVRPGQVGLDALMPDSLM
jgi:hypothetical protein